MVSLGVHILPIINVPQAFLAATEKCSPKKQVLAIVKNTKKTYGTAIWFVPLSDKIIIQKQLQTKGGQWVLVQREEAEAVFGIKQNA